MESGKFPKVSRSILLNPGPATTTDTVKFAQVVSDICPREKEFGDILENIAKKLVSFACEKNPEDYTAVLFGGSGTLAVEAMISSSIGKDEGFIVVSNGIYGQRMSQIAEIHNLSNFWEFTGDYFSPLDLDLLEDTVKSFSPACLSVVHSETTTGMLNDIRKIGEICKKHKVKMLVDGMSSFGAIPLDMNDDNISVLTASSNKCIQGMPGVSFCICRNDFIETMKNKEPKSLYMDIPMQCDFFKKNKQIRFTPPVQTIYALNQALVELEKETIQGRYKRYSESWETLMEELNRLGFNCPLPMQCSSKIITCINEPGIEGFSFENLHDFLYSKGITIYPGRLTDLNMFRIANIGDINKTDILNTGRLIEEYLDILKSLSGQVIA